MLRIRYINHRSFAPQAGWLKWTRIAALCAVAPLWACATAPPALDFDALLRNGEALYSQGKEELIVRHFFAIAGTASSSTSAATSGKI